MVRLGVISKCFGLFVIKFQFHYGAIGRLACANFKLIAALISIPLWCDWELLPRKAHTLYCLFQFHYGAIGSLGVDINVELQGIFQFHYGAIGSCFFDLK